MLLFTAVGILFMLVGTYYYYLQNQSERLGGHISAPKAYWLFFCLYVYYAVPVMVLIQLQEFPNTITWFYLGICLILLIRMVVQLLWMFVLKKWTPNMGISFNVILCGYLWIGAGLIYLKGEHNLFLLTAILISLHALTDSYYAWVFKTIVGSKTMGEEAVWYAHPEKTEFKKINRITNRINLLLSLFWLIHFYFLFK